MSLWGGLDIVGVDVAPPPEVGSAGSMVLHLHHKCALDIDCKPLSQADSCSTASDQDPKCVGPVIHAKQRESSAFKQGSNKGLTESLHGAFARHTACYNTQWQLTIGLYGPL